MFDINRRTHDGGFMSTQSICSSLGRRTSDALESLWYAAQTVVFYGLYVVLRLVILAFIAVAGYLAGEYLMPILPHAFSVRWYEAAIVLGMAVLGIIAVHTEFFEDLVGDGALAASLTGTVGFCTAGYFATSRPPLLHWEILTITVAALAAFIIAAIGEYLVCALSD